MEKHDFVTIADLSKEKILYMIQMAKEFEMHPNREILKGKVVATLFFEPSTRTRLSFETAANRLGAKVIGFSDAKVTSATKGETLKDTILMVSNYADVIATPYRGSGTIRIGDCTDSYHQRRRRSTPAPVTMHARPILHIQDAGNS